MRLHFGMNFAYGFQLNDYRIINQKINPEVIGNDFVFIHNRNQYLSFNDVFSRLQLNLHSFLVNAFEQPRTKCFMNFNSSAYHTKAYLI